MKGCLDCGREIGEGERYCPHCGSPAEIRMPTDAELRIETFGGVRAEQGRSRLTTYLTILLFLGLALLVLFISRTISKRLDLINAGF